MESNRDASEFNHKETWGFWATLIWACAISLVFVLVQTAVLYAYVGLAPQGFSDEALFNIENDGNFISLATFASSLICTGMIWLAIRSKKKSNTIFYLELNKISLRTALSCVAITALFIGATDVVTYYLGKPLVHSYVISIYESSHSIWILLICVAIFAPIFEELFFRGFIFRGFLSTLVGKVGAVFFTSLLWCLVHSQYDTYTIFIIFLFGIIFSIAKILTKSMYAPIVMHSTMNAVGILKVMVY